MATHVVLLARVGEEVGLAVGHLIVRTIYTPSKLKSMRIMRDNSGICELLDLAIESVTQRKVYSVADWFLKEKVKIEKNLCQTTDDLFKPTNRIMSTQKAVTSEAVNAMGEKVEMRICSTPTEQAADIYSMLNYKKMPFRKIKVCRTQSP